MFVYLPSDSPSVRINQMVSNKEKIEINPEIAQCHSHVMNGLPY